LGYWHKRGFLLSEIAITPDKETLPLGLFHLYPRIVVMSERIAASEGHVGENILPWGLKSLSSQYQLHAAFRSLRGGTILVLFFWS